MRVKVDYRVNSKSNYEQFCKLHPDIDVSYKDWNNVLHTFFSSFREEVLETGNVCKLPYGFGEFTITKKKAKRYKNFTDDEGNHKLNLRVDWKATKEEGKYVYHFNFHTDGYTYRWKWFSKTARFYTSRIFLFRASRVTNRLLKVYLKKPNSEYFQIYRDYSFKRIF